jgi:hypothetical protein
MLIAELVLDASKRFFCHALEPNMKSGSKSEVKTKTKTETKTKQSPGCKTVILVSETAL